MEREPIRSGRPSPPEGVPDRSSSKICSSHDSSPLPLPSPPPSPSCCFAAGRKIECEHGRSICPKESLIFGRCPPTIFVLVENYISPGRTAGGRVLSWGSPRRRSAAHNNPDRAPLMSHNGPASMRNRRWWPRTWFPSTLPSLFLPRIRIFPLFSFSPVFNSLSYFLFRFLPFSVVLFLYRRYTHCARGVMGPCHLISSDYFYIRSRARSWISIYWAWLQNSTVITCVGRVGR